MFNSTDIKYTMNGVDHVAPIRVFEGFAGYGGARFGLRHSGVAHEVIGCSKLRKVALAL